MRNANTPNFEPVESRRTAMSTSYKLVYFNIRGRAETCRFIFAQAGVKYEDKRVAQEEWPGLKPNTPTGQLPVLEVDGKELAGSKSIARFLGERFGLAGSNDFENADLDSLVDLMSDFFDKIVTFFFSTGEEQIKVKKQLEDEHIPRFFGIIEKRFQANNSADGWICGNKPTYADFSIYTTGDYVGAIFPDVLEKYPGLVKMRASVEALPNIANWLKERPKTD